MNHPQVASNHPDGTRFVDVLRRELRQATRVEAAVSFLRFSGLGLILQELQDFVARGGQLRLLTSTYLNVTQPDALRALMSWLPAGALRVFDAHADLGLGGGGPGFHPKVWIFAEGSLAPRPHSESAAEPGARPSDAPPDAAPSAPASTRCWVGSSNLTRGGLAANLELNALHTDPGVAEALGRELRHLWDHPATRIPDTAFLAAYAARYLAAAPGNRVRSPTMAPSGQAAPASSAPSTAGPPAPTLVAAEPASSWGVAAPGPAAPDAPRKIPNEAQREALSRLAALREHDERRAVIIAATGIGKTLLAAFDAAAVGAQSILFASHRLEHLRQAQRAFAEVLPRHTTALLDGQSEPRFAREATPSGPHVLCASIQTLARRPELSARRWDYVVIDELHHAAGASYATVLARLDADFLLGLTATPERQDGHDVLALCDHNVAWEVRLPEAIRRGWLVPFHYFGVDDTTVDYSRIPWRNGSFNPEDLDHALAVEARAELALRHALEKGYDGHARATVGFCVSRRHARFMASAFRARGQLAEAVTGETPISAREALYERFSDRGDPLAWLFVADILNEGVDLPAINSILFLRPTESPTLFLQQLGRGLRHHPDCQVLTVVDLVGHHRSAWLPLTCLADPAALPGPASFQSRDVVLTPPAGCAFLLEDRTREMLARIVSHSGATRRRVTEGWERLRRELGAAPWPVDFIGRETGFSPEDVLSVFSTWSRARVALGDAEPWEVALGHDDPLQAFLSRCEKDWQAQRCHPYALVWALVTCPDDPRAGLAAFLDRFPRWRVELELADPKALRDDLPGLSTVEKKLDGLVVSGRLLPRILGALPPEALQREVERRLLYRLARDYHLRHGGVLRDPSALVRWRRYSRAEILHHFGRQYDPARHNAGVLTFQEPEWRDDIVLITSLDTSDAKATHQYRNGFDGPATFRWQSQNRNTPESEPGLRLITPGRARLHLFVQERKGQDAIYCGCVTPTRHEGSRPINVWFRLETPLPEGVLKVMNA